MRNQEEISTSKTKTHKRKSSQGSSKSTLQKALWLQNFIVAKPQVKKLGELGYSKAEIYDLVAPTRTLNRRTNELSLEESDRVNRLERISTHAKRVFGSLEVANNWLREENRALRGIRPIDLLISETGAHEVKMQLHAIDYGIYE